jgi:hypothetical protein
MTRHVTVWRLLSCLSGASSLTRGRVCCLPFRLNFFKVKVLLRPTVSRPVFLGVRHPFGDPWPICLLTSLITFRQLLVCWSGAPSLKTVRVCSFQLLLCFASAVFLGSEFRGTHDRNFCLNFLDSPQPGCPGFCIYFPQEQGSPFIPQALGEFLLNNMLYIGTQ